MLCEYSMATFESDKSANDSLEALFDERALLYDVESLPEAGKTPTTPVQGADLAAAVDGGKGDLGLNSMPGQGLHVSSSLQFEFKFTSLGFQLASSQFSSL